MLKQIKRGDGVLVWFNLFCLLFVALLPASAGILSRYPNAFLAITCFALDVALIQLSTLWLWRHASRQGLINPMLDPRVVVSIRRRLTLSTVIFALSIPLALWNIWITYLFWVGLFLLLFTTDWLSWQLSTRKQQTSFPLEDVKRASIYVHHEAGHLRIDSKAAENILLDGVFGGGLESHVARSEDAANIKLKVPKRTGLLSWKYPWSWGSASILDWTLHVSDQIPLALEMETYAGELTLELGALQITDLKIKVESSSTQISLPDREGTTIVNIESITAKLMIRLPAGVAASIHNEMGIGTVEGDLARFLMLEKERHYQSANYETATKRVQLRIGGTTSSVQIV
jgi:predicted membrane protein